MRDFLLKVVLNMVELREHLLIDLVMVLVEILDFLLEITSDDLVLVDSVLLLNGKLVAERHSLFFDFGVHFLVVGLPCFSLTLDLLLHLFLLGHELVQKVLQVFLSRLTLLLDLLLQTDHLLIYLPELRFHRLLLHPLSLQMGFIQLLDLLILVVLKDVVLVDEFVSFFLQHFLGVFNVLLNVLESLLQLHLRLIPLLQQIAQVDLESFRLLIQEVDFLVFFLQLFVLLFGDDCLGFFIVLRIEAPLLEGLPKELRLVVFLVDVFLIWFRGSWLGGFCRRLGLRGDCGGVWLLLIAWFHKTIIFFSF